MARVKLPDNFDMLSGSGLAAVNGTSRWLNADTATAVNVYSARTGGTTNGAGAATITNGRAAGWVDDGVTLNYYVTPSGSTEQGPFEWQASAGTSMAVLKEAPYNIRHDNILLGDGRNARGAIQSRIDALQTAAGTRRGFELLIPEGVYTIDTNTIYAVSKLTLMGAGKDKTILKQPADTAGSRANWSIIRGRGADGTTNGQVDNFTLRDLTLQGNGDAANQIADQTTEAGHNLIFYGAENHRIINVESKNSRQYGLSYEGIPGQPAELGALCKNLYMESVDLHHNGRADYYSVVPAQYRDGLDVKACDMTTLIGCRAWSNGEKGFDIRSHASSWLNCEAWDHPNSSFSAHSPATATGALDGYANFTGCLHKGQGNGWFFNLPSTGMVCRVGMTNCYSDSAIGSAIVVTDGTRLYLMINGGAYRLSTLHGLSAGTTIAHLAIGDGAEFSGNGGYGLNLHSAQDPLNLRLGRLKLDGNTSGAINYSGTSRAIKRAATRAPVAEPDYNRRNGQTGVVAPSARGYNASNVTVVAQRVYLSRFVPSEDMAVTLMAFGVTTAASVDDAVHVGIYDETGARVATSGAVTGKLNATGTKNVTVSASLTAGSVYYAALLVPAIGGTAAAVTGANFAATTYASLFGGTIGLVESANMDSQSSLPATVTTTALAITAQIAVRES